MTKERITQWLIDAGLLVVGRVMPVLLVALIGAMVDAGLLDGQLGAAAVDALRASSSKLSEAVAAWPHPRPNLG